MTALAPKEQAPQFGACDAKPRTFASEAAAALYIVIGAATGSDDLDRLVSQVWQGVVHGAIDEGDADFLQSFAERRRTLAVGRRGVGGRAVGKIASRFAPRRSRRLTSEQKQAARERRRKLGSSADAPANIRCQYTEGERAVLFVIVGEVKHHGLCDLPIGKIAALAGVGRTTAQNALREARRLEHVKVTERPQPGRESLTNIIHITSPEWLAWLKRGPTAHRAARGGFKSVKILNPTKISNEKRHGEKDQRRGSGPPERWGRQA